ncbi:ADP/ATP translocase [Aphelenchoides bicaudatus]|nr:ADP/ATP translocase [Aphelenchoides bicaudatus]
MSSFASTSETSDFLNVLRGFGGGAVATLISKSMTAPIDRVKLVLQLQNRSSTMAGTSEMSRQTYNGMLDCFKRLCSEQGVASLWRGNSANVIRCFPSHALNFVLRDQYRILFLRNVDKHKQYGRFVFGNILAGGAGGCTSLMLLYPLDLARTRLAVETKRNGSPKFNGIYDCLRKITAREGFVGNYRGFLVSLQFVALSRAVFFGMFDTARCTITDDMKKLHFVTVFLIAQACVVTSGWLCYPMDTVRRKLMLQSGQSVKPYNGTIDCFLKTFEKGGVRSFYKGVIPNTTKSISGALLVSLYYESLKYL